jgi:hydrogenase expression/formation protein HypD
LSGFAEVLAEFRRSDRVRALTGMIRDNYRGGAARIMEVCGTHTMSIARFGIRSLLPAGVRLISGPGCPVCVTPAPVVDAAVEIAGKPRAVVVTFGDMMRVPGSGKTLEARRAEGADVRVVYSALDAVAMAEREPDKRFVFVSVGFETTTPGIALTVMEAERQGLKNLSFLTANRLVIPAMEALCRSGDVAIDGFLCPGHVSVVIGSDAYRGIVRDFGIPCVVSGFEPVDILIAILALLRQMARRKAGESVEVENAYGRAVTGEGNLRAMEIMGKVFRVVDAEWRGIGVIARSGLALGGAYAGMDALSVFGDELGSFAGEAGRRPAGRPAAAASAGMPAGCRCGDVLRGVIVPPECPLFGKRCVPESPVGPCMVSSEGSCAAYYKYGSGEE